MTRLQQQGAVAALEFCNEKAYPLTDSMATANNANIRRVSDKPRNPANQETKKELEQIAFFKDRIAANLPNAPILREDGESINFYCPMVTNTMCLTCHGIPKTTIEPNILLSHKKKLTL